MSARTIGRSFASHRLDDTMQHLNVFGTMALNKEHSIDFFVSPTALFVIEFTQIEEITRDSVKEALRNRMWLQMAVLLGAWGR